jgi:hypothetical protein
MDKLLRVESFKPESKLFGKYRGVVKNNIDPLALGRVVAQVPAVPLVLNWAMPCTPYPVKGIPGAVPPIGAHVWIEFEGGDLNMPIWTGCFWSPGDTPLLLLP